MAAVSPVPKPLWLFRFGVFAGWSVFTLMVVAITWAGAVMRDRKFDLGGTFVWNLGWLLWAGTTFFVAHLARRFPIARKTLTRDVGLHVGMGLAVAAAILWAEFVLNVAMRRVWPDVVPANALVGFFVYKFHVYFLIYGMIVGGTRAFDYYAFFQASELTASRLEAQLAQAQLHALKMQLHPHFLFNTHHSIVSLMLKNENSAAIKMLTRLSELLRITLSQHDRQVTTVREELLALELYLGIQMERYRERLVIHREVSADTLEAELPCLLLQPIVENALKHGIDSLGAGGELRVSLGREGERLCVKVSDNGRGVSAGFDHENKPASGSAIRRLGSSGSMAATTTLSFVADRRVARSDALISTLVVDDEPLGRDLVRHMLASHGDFRIAAECGDGEEALTAITRLQPQLVFLDVKMPRLDGLGVLERIRPADRPLVVFITAHDAYAIKAFEAHALDYLLKPFDQERFDQTVDRVRTRVEQLAAVKLSKDVRRLLSRAASPASDEVEDFAPTKAWLDRIVIRESGRIYFVAVEEIQWLEASGNYVALHVASGKTHLVHETMANLEAKLDPAEFVRIHRGTIVKVERIKELQPHFNGEYIVLLKDEVRLKLSRGYLEKARSALGLG